MGDEPSPSLVLDAARPRAGYVASFDAARLLACLGVIWVHASMTYRFGGIGADFLGRFAVPFFTFGLVFFAARGTLGRPEKRWGEYLCGRFLRIYLPMLGWSVIYVVMKGDVAGWWRGGAGWGALWLLWGGAAYHLWFLPFVFVMSVVMFPVMQAVAARPGMLGGVVAVAGVLGFGVALTPVHVPGMKEAVILNLAWLAMPSALWGIAAACAERRWGGVKVPRGVMVAVGAVLLVGCTAASSPYPHWALMDNLAGLGLVLWGLSDVDGAWIRGAAGLGKLSYGIYLSHVIFVGAARTFAGRMHFDRSVGFIFFALIVALAGSTVLSWLLTRSRATRWLVGL